MSDKYISDDDVISVDSNFNLADATTQTDFTKNLQNSDIIHFEIEPIKKKSNQIRSPPILNNNTKTNDLKIISNVNGSDLKQPFTLIVKNNNIVVDIQIENNKSDIKVIKDDITEREIHIDEVTFINKLTRYIEYFDTKFDQLCHKVYSCFDNYRQIEHYELQEIDNERERNMYNMV